VKIYVAAVCGGGQAKRKEGMKLSLLLKLVGGNAQLVISFRTISFPVTHLMPYYAKTGRFHVFVIQKSGFYF